MNIRLVWKGMIEGSKYIRNYRTFQVCMSSVYTSCLVRTFKILFQDVV